MAPRYFKQGRDVKNHSLEPNQVQAQLVKYCGAQRRGVTLAWL